MLTSGIDSETPVAKRDRLADLLTQAAQVEHSVLAEYLFAAFSLKRTEAEGGVTLAQLETMRGWSKSLMLVARQEMAHLGLVSNLLTAIGHAPVFRRPSFPIPAGKFPLETRSQSSLEALSQKCVLRFVCYEMPKRVNRGAKRYLEKYLGDFTESTYDGIYQLYVEILDLLKEIDQKVLFIGPPWAQFQTGGNSVLARGRDFPKSSTGRPIYDMSIKPVTDLKSAKAAIEQIITEGEGAESVPHERVDAAGQPSSHFSRFLEMHRQLTEQGTDFKPARNVVSNPQIDTGDGPPVPGVHYVTHGYTKKVMTLFDNAYGTMLLMLMRYFAHTDESGADLMGVQDTVFFPMMTAGIRPLAEILTQLPAYKGGKTDYRAGPSFIIPESIQLLPHRQSAWRVIGDELQMLAERADDIRKEKPPGDVEDQVGKQLQQRLTLIHENFGRMARTFKAATNSGETSEKLRRI
jgi:hypothetical protein